MFQAGNDSRFSWADFDEVPFGNRFLLSSGDKFYLAAQAQFYSVGVYQPLVGTLNDRTNEALDFTI
jgi:hypothetical protein